MLKFKVKLYDDSRLTQFPLGHIINYGSSSQSEDLIPYWCTSPLGHIGSPCVFCDYRQPENEQ